MLNAPDYEATPTTGPCPRHSRPDGHARPVLPRGKRWDGYHPPLNDTEWHAYHCQQTSSFILEKKHVHAECILLCKK